MQVPISMVALILAYIPDLIVIKIMNTVLKPLCLIRRLTVLDSLPLFNGLLLCYKSQSPPPFEYFN